MDKFGNYIYAIIIIGSIILSIIQGAAKKKKQQQSQSTSPIPRKKSWDEIFGELVEKEKPKPAVIQKPIPKTQVSQSIYQTKQVTNASISKNREKWVETPKEASLPRHLDINLENASDWQKAFVYSEIFNRKY